MANTNRYKVLKKRIDELGRHLLPNCFSPTGSYPNKVIEIARGYKLLVHAEIESYLEDIATLIVTEALRFWKKKKITSHTLVALLSCYHCSWNSDNEEIIIKLANSRKRLEKNIQEIIDRASAQFNTIIKNNHGIRETNLRKIVLPTGVELQNLDATWLSLMDTFGQQRGEVAHNTKKATSQINPKDELQNVQGIMKGIKELDQQYVKILKDMKK